MNLRSRHGSRFPRAFSLIELMVVVGLITALVAFTGVALSGRGGDGVALSNAQVTLTGLVGATRAQAALHQTSARLIIYANQPPATNADSNKYLRALQVVRAETTATGATVWVAAGNSVILPAPICIVPATPVPANHLKLPAGQTWNNNAATGPVSTLTTLNSFGYSGQSSAPGRAAVTQYFGAAGSGRVLYIEFDSTGTVVSNTSTNPTKIALTTAILAPNVLPQFNNASAVRGLFVRKSGAISLVNDATAF